MGAEGHSAAANGSGQVCDLLAQRSPLMTDRSMGRRLAAGRLARPADEQRGAVGPLQLRLFVQRAPICARSETQGQPGETHGHQIGAARPCARPQPPPPPP